MVRNMPEVQDNSEHRVRPLGEERVRDFGREEKSFEPGDSGIPLWPYLVEVGKIPLLDEEEERSLAREIQRGQRDLLHRLLALNLEMDEMAGVKRGEMDVSDEVVAAIMRELENRVREKRIPVRQQERVLAIQDLYHRLIRLKGEMLRGNLRLVIKIAKGYAYPGVDLSDLIQEGNLGLMKAVTKFDYRRGYRFSTYASWWIRQAIQKSMAEKGGTIRVPLHVREKKQRLTKAYAEILRKRGKAPQPEEVAKKARVPLETALGILSSFPETVSMETPVGEDSSILSFIQDERTPTPSEAMERKEDREMTEQMTEKMLSGLPPRTAEILRLRFGIGGNGGMTLEGIGKRFGISRERVRQLEKKGIRQLRRSKEELSPQLQE
jgi:RNA polymerase primary sigma factor